MTINPTKLNRDLHSKKKRTKTATHLHCMPQTRNHSHSTKSRGSCTYRPNNAYSNHKQLKQISKILHTIIRWAFWNKNDDDYKNGSDTASLYYQMLLFKVLPY